MSVASVTRGVVVLGAAIVVLAGCGSSAPSQQRDVVAASAGAVTVHEGAGRDAAAASSGLVVDVAGAVRRPGVYRLAKGTRVHEAIAAAGGGTREADTSSLNRAAEVVDGQQILVPTRSGAGGTEAAARRGVAPGAKVSINTADVAALDQLPGIGPVTAQRIVDDRTKNGPFASVDDLDRVSGIGPSTLEQLEGVATT